MKSTKFTIPKTSILSDHISNPLILKGTEVVVGITVLFVAFKVGAFARDKIIANAERVRAAQYRTMNNKITDESFGAAQAMASDAGQPKAVNLVSVFIAWTVFYTIVIMGILFVMSIVGIETTGAIAILAALSFAIGLSLQGTLSDMAAGIIIVFFNTFAIGDIIQIGETQGRVVRFSLVYTGLEDIHNLTYTIIPNRRIHDNMIINLTRSKYRLLVVDILLSNKNKDFAGIARMIIDDITKFPWKYPDVWLDKHIPSAGVYDMSKPWTLMRVKVCILSTGVADGARTRVHQKIRELLSDKGVLLIEPTSVSP